MKADYELGQDNIRICGLDIHNPVFAVSSLTVIGFVAGVLVFQEDAATTFGMLRTWLTSTFDWVLMVAANLFLLFCLLLLVTPLGRRATGWPSRTAGLMFFGVAEPVAHFLQPPLGSDGTDAVITARPSPPSGRAWRTPPRCTPSTTFETLLLPARPDAGHSRTSRRVTMPTIHNSWQKPCPPY